MNQQKRSSKRSKKDLAGHLSAGLEKRQGGRLRSMLAPADTPKPVAVPMADDAYEVIIDHIKPDPDQPRKLFDQEQLDQLAQSIKENGVLQPLSVYLDHNDPRSYFLIHGERRWRAAKLAGLTSVPAIVRTISYDKDRVQQQQLVENVQRADLEPLEAARALKHWMDERQLSQRDAAGRLGKPKTWVAELLGVLSLPDKVLKKAEEKRLGKMALVELSRVKDTDEQHELFKRMLKGNTPWSEAKKTRQEKERTVTYRQRFALEGSPYAVTVAADKHPDEVDLVQVIEALQRLTAQLQQELRDQQGSGRSSTGKRRGA